MAKFRFQDLRIWQFSIQIADELFDIADELDSLCRQITGFKNIPKIVLLSALRSMPFDL